MSLTWEIPVATVLHLGMFTLMFVVGTCAGSSEPLFSPEDVMIVEMGGPALLDARMPQKAERAPDLTHGDLADPAKVNPDQIPFQTPDAKGDKTNDADRERILRDLLKEQALKDLTAPLGTTDRAATSPDGTQNPDGATAVGINDPELARWVKAARDAVLPNWKPIRSYCVADPDLTVQARVPVAADGTLTGKPEVARPSGNSSLDGSLVRAIEATGKLPPPPRGELTATVQMKCKDIL